MNETAEADRTATGVIDVVDYSNVTRPRIGGDHFNASEGNETVNGVSIVGGTNVTYN